MKNYAVAETAKEIKYLSKKKIVLVGGTFDLLHIGHVDFLEKSKKLGDILIVGITSDKEVKSRKDKIRPILSQKQRAKIVSSLKSVDYVFISNKSAYSEGIISIINPDILVFSLEHNTKRHRIKYKDEIQKNFPKIKVKFINSTPKISTTKIIKKIIDLSKKSNGKKAH